MRFQVSRTDTGQFVLMDPSTETVIIEDDLAVGFAKLEQVLANAPAKPTTTLANAGAATPASQASTTFQFVGGPRYTPVLLAVVLPFAWLAVLYLALANLLSEHALDRGSARETQTKIEELEREVKALRSEISGVPRTAKSKPKRQAETKPEPAAPSTAPQETEPQAEDDGPPVEKPAEGIR